MRTSSFDPPLTPAGMRDPRPPPESVAATHTLPAASERAEVPPVHIATTRHRFENWDRLRVVAAFDTVAIHLIDQHALLGVGLPLFLMLSVALGVSRPQPPPTGRFLRRRFDRVIVPWVFWSLAMAAHRTVFAALDGREPFGWFEWPMLFYGPRIHLWFLPAVIVGGLFAHLAHRATGHWPARRAAAVGLLLGIALLPLPPQLHLGWPLEQWLFMVPAIPLGFALGRLVASEPRREDLRRTLLIALVCIGAVGFLIAMIVPDTKHYVFRFFGGFGLLVAATWLPNRSDALTARLVPLMLGVYVLHPWIYAVFVKGVLERGGLADAKILVVLSGFAAALAVTAGLRCVPFFRRFL